jgi:hypothetical protein
LRSISVPGMRISSPLSTGQGVTRSSVSVMPYTSQTLASVHALAAAVSSNALSVSVSSMQFSGLGSTTQPITISETGYTGGFGIKNPCTDLYGHTIATWAATQADVGPNVTFNVTAVANGSCAMQIFDTNTPRSVVYVPVQVGPNIALGGARGQGSTPGGPM